MAMPGERGTSTKAIESEMEQAFGQVPEWMGRMPGPARAGFWRSFRDFYFAETCIPNKYKELIGVAVAGATRCRYSALLHSEAARVFGATDEEIAEAGALAGLVMDGSTFVNAQGLDFDRFRKETLEMLAWARVHHAGAAAKHAGHTAAAAHP
jgi:AhpD family alkylhydroperoxidase